jgi:large subunit ribosomal protein L17
MLSNMAISILDKERITTTVAKAKEVRGVVERLITYGKKGDLHAIRLAARRINDEKVLKKLFEDIAPSYKERNGGYTRILKTENRKGDNAPMAIIELVGRSGHNDPIRKRSGAKKKPAAKKTTAKKASVPVEALEETVAIETPAVEEVAVAETEEATVVEEVAAAETPAVEETESESKD